MTGFNNLLNNEKPKNLNSEGVKKERVSASPEKELDYPKGVLGEERAKPSKTPNANAKSKGRPAKILDQQDAATKRSLLRENESAKTLAQKGYDVEQSPLIEGTTKKSDYLIEGKVFDCYAPDSSKARICIGNREKDCW